jgi:hypothetical protein
MFSLRQTKSILWGLLAVVTTYTMVDTVDAQTRRLRFDPAYGEPFVDPGNNDPNNILGWKGYADVSYGTCDSPGTVTNLPGSCNGALSFLGATVELYNTTNSNAVLQTINFVGGQIAAMTFDNSSNLTQVYSSPFNPVVGIINETKYDGVNQAYFSLIFVGEYAQLYWFKNNPGNPLVNPLAFPYVNGLTAIANYGGCYFAGPGDNNLGFNRCGLSSNLDGAGAQLTITAVPEAEAYMLALAGLGVLGVTGSISRRRKSKRQHTARFGQRGASQSRQ